TDGTTAQLIVPDSLNGVFAVRVIGSPFETPLQIVPIVDTADVTNSLCARLTGRGFYEGAATYRFGQANVVDSDTSLGPDVAGSGPENSRADVQFPVSGF